MRDDSVSSQIFSVITVAIMISSSYLLLFHKEDEANYDTYVSVWARNQLNYDTEQAYSFVLEQGPYELLETDNEFDSVHVMIPYNLPESEGGAAIDPQCLLDVDSSKCPHIS